MNLLSLILLTIFSLPSKSQNCGQFTFNAGLIVNGDATTRGEFPFLVALLMLREQSFFCAANLISQRHAVTAAHCMLRKYSSKPLDKDDFIALLGKYNLKHIYEKGVVSMEISKIIIHEDWKPYVNRYDADIAILFFEKEAQLSEFIQIICLPSRWEAADELKEGKVVGWGLSERMNFTRGEETPRKIEIKKPPTNEFCFLHEKTLLELSSNRTFCAGGENAGPCLGDSGGGFFVNSNSFWTLQGLVSSTLLSSDLRCEVTKYSIYTNVAFYVDWMDEKINDLRPITMDCQLYHGRNRKYACGINGTSITRDDLIFKVVVGDHLPGKTDSDIKLLRLNENDSDDEATHADIRYIPSGISDVLPNLSMLYIQSANLTKISRRNFRKMTLLQVISLTNNRIEYVDEDTFFEVPRLRSLRINGNRLKSIHLNLLVYSNNLVFFVFDGNFIEEIDGEIFRNCPRLQSINLEDNSLRKITIDLSKFTKLSKVNLEENVCINSNYINGSSTSLEEFQNLINKSC